MDSWITAIASVLVMIGMPVWLAHMARRPITKEKK